MTQTVSHFRQFAAYRKEGSFWPTRNTYNLFVFNILWWASTAPGMERQSPGMPAFLAPLLGANRTPNPTGNMLTLAGILPSFIPENLDRQKPRRSPRGNDGRKEGDSHRHQRNP
jgi:hypothetical protein